MAVSREYGLDLMQIYKNSINKNKFKVFLDELRRKYWTDDILLIMDNLAVHRNGEVKKLMDELGFHYAYTPVASPQYNGIEEVIGMGKAIVKKRRMEAIIKGEEIDMDKLIETSFNDVNP